MLRRIVMRGWWPVFETVEQVRAAVREWTDAVWVLSAMAPVLASGLEGPFSVDDPAARVLADYGLLEATESELLPPPAFVDHRTRRHHRRQPRPVRARPAAVPGGGGTHG